MSSRTDVAKITASPIVSGNGRDLADVHLIMLVAADNGRCNRRKATYAPEVSVNRSVSHSAYLALDDASLAWQCSSTCRLYLHVTVAELEVVEHWSGMLFPFGNELNGNLRAIWFRRSLAPA
jgi:hypothetical protein